MPGATGVVVSNISAGCAELADWRAVVGMNVVVCGRRNRPSMLISAVTCGPGPDGKAKAR